MITTIHRVLSDLGNTFEHLPINQFICTSVYIQAIPTAFTKKSHQKPIASDECIG